VLQEQTISALKYHTQKRHIYLNINLKLETQYMYKSNTETFPGNRCCGRFFMLFHVFSEIPFVWHVTVQRLLSVTLPVTFLGGQGAMASHMKSEVGTLALTCSRKDC
jgi:hypothetical protein